MGMPASRLFYYATETFGDFTLRLQFKIFDAAKHNSGVFVRFPVRPSPLPPALQARTVKESFRCEQSGLEAGHCRLRSPDR